MGLHKQWFRKVVRSDDGYEIAFAEKVNRVQKVRYSEGTRSLTTIGEPVLTSPERKWGLHFALADKYLDRWDDGTRTTTAERDAIRAGYPRPWTSLA
jgi:hypothetical protein